MNVLKHVCGISLCITMRLSNLSPQTSSFSPTLQTFLSPLSSSLHIQILQCAELGGAPLNLHPHPTNPPPHHPSLSRKDPARRSLSWTGKTPAPPVRNLLLEASWMNNPQRFDSGFIIWEYDETPPMWNGLCRHCAWLLIPASWKGRPAVRKSLDTHGPPTRAVSRTIYQQTPICLFVSFSVSWSCPRMSEIRNGDKFCAPACSDQQEEPGPRASQRLPVWQSWSIGVVAVQTRCLAHFTLSRPRHSLVLGLGLQEPGKPVCV